MSTQELETLQSRAPVLKQEIEAKNQEVAKRISHAYAEANRAMSNALGFAIVAGLMMLERKEECPHGEFGPWLAKYCPEIQWRSATNYMNASRSAVAHVLGDAAAKGQIGNDFQFDGTPLYQVLAADPTTLTKESRDVQGRFKDFLQGKTQHQLLLDWKEIREKSKERTPRTEPTADEVASAQARMADESLLTIIGDIDRFVLSGTTLQAASDKVKAALLEKGIEMNARLREASASAKNKGARAKSAARFDARPLL